MTPSWLVREGMKSSRRLRRSDVLVVFAWLLVVGLVLYLTSRMERSARRHEPLLEASDSLKQKVAMAHFWWRQAATSDGGEKRRNFFANLDEAILMTDALLNGSSTALAGGVPRVEEDALLAELAGIRARLQLSRQIAESVWQEGRARGAETAAGIGVGDVLGELWTAADRVGGEMASALAAEHKRMGRVNAGIIIVLLLLFCLVGMAANGNRRQVEVRRTELQAAFDERSKQLIEVTRRERAVIDAVIDGIITIDETGTVESLNPAAERMFGYRADEVVGRNVKMLMPEPYRAAHDGYLTAYLRTGVAKVIGIGREVIGLRKDGSSFDMELQVAEMRTDERRIFVGIVRDITDRKRSEQQMRLQASALEAAANAIMIADTSGVVSWVNPAFTSLTGYTPDEIIGRHTRMLKSGLHDTAFYSAMWQCVGAGRTWHGEVINRKKDGSHYIEEMTITPVRDGAGAVASYIAIKQDVTERRRTAEALRESEERYRDLFENATDLIMSTAPDGRLLYVNRAWRETLGYDEGEISGLTLRNFVDWECLPRYMRVFERVLGGESADKVDAVFYSKDGRRIVVEGSISCRMVDGMPSSTRAIFRDVTQRKEIERMKNEFISTVSHELRTPLTSIRGSLSLVVGGVAGQLPTQAESLISIAFKNSERLVRLINDILDIEQIESGKMVFNLHPVEITPLLEHALESIRPYGEELGVRFRMERVEADAMICVDDDRLMQVIINLLANAAKFSPDGGSVDVTVSRLDGRVRVAVTDSGPGIPESFRGRVFEKFAQADSSDTRVRGGTGLGLSISKTIVEGLGGRIGFESEAGRGATFYFDFPEWRKDGTGLKPEDHLPAERGPRLLVCEDELVVASLMKRMLQSGGYAVDVAHDAAQARRLLERNHYDVMTVDIGLPDEDGISLIAELRRHERTRHLPIIVVSGRAEEAGFAGGALGIVDWLSKPLDQARLIDAVRIAAATRPSGKPRILHVESDADVRHVVSMVLTDVAQLFSAGSLREARHLLAVLPFDLLLLEVTLPDGNGIELLSLLRRSTGPQVPVIIYSSQDVALDAGQRVAAALVKSRTTNEELLQQVTDVIRTAAAENRVGGA